MRYTNFTCTVLPVADKKVLRTIHDAITKIDWDVENIGCVFKHVSGRQDVELEDMVGSNPVGGIVQDANSSLLKTVVVKFKSTSAHFQYENNMRPDQPNVRPIATFDFEGLGEDAGEELKKDVSIFVSTIRKGLGAIDGAEGLGHILGPNQKSHFKTREQELVRLEGVADNFFERLQAFEARREEDFLQKQTELDERLILKSKELEVDHKERMKAQAEKEVEWESRRTEKEKALDEWEKRLEALSNTDERRQTRKQIRAELEKREAKFGLTDGTQAKRKPVHLIFLAIIVGALVAFGVFLWLLIADTSNDTWTRILLIARVALAGVVFFTTLIYYLRWNMDWFERHAAEEFRNKRQILDMDRATWLSEFALEWYGVTESELPTAIFESLSRELYETDGSSRPQKNNAADVVASALFGSASKIRGKLGNAEVELDRKSAKKMEKEGFCEK